MKKLYSLLLAIMMIATIALPVFAEESVDANGGSANVNVNGVVQYTGSSETQTISVDIAWEPPRFHHSGNQTPSAPSTSRPSPSAC